MSAVTSPTPFAAPRPKGYVPAVGPRLKKLLFVVSVLVALLGANSLYLVSITVLEAVTAQTYQNFFYQCMFLLHLVLGLLLVTGLTGDGGGRASVAVEPGLAKLALVYGAYTAAWLILAADLILILRVGGASSTLANIPSTTGLTQAA